MSNKLKILAFFLIFGSSVAYADSFKALLTSLSMDYTERDSNGNFLDSEKSDYGDIDGLELAYSMDFASGHGGADSSSLEFDFAYSRTKSNYDGFLQAGGVIVAPFTTTTDMTIYEPRIRWRETKKTDAYDVSVFTSLGYRYWVRDINSAAYGYKEEYSWAYGDVGMRVMFHDNSWHIGLEGAYQKAYAPKLHADLAGGLDFDLGDTSGYNLSVPLVYDVNKNTSIELSYEYDYWDISASNVVNGYFEPDSETKNETIKLGIIIKW